MTRDEIEKMPAGRLMDIAIEVDVFKTENIVHPHYSTDIAAAWLVVEKLAKEPYAWYIHSINLTAGLRYSADYWGEPDSPDGEIISYNATAETAPLAICRAALMAVQK